MCRAKSEGGYRCPCSGGRRPTPKTEEEKRELRQSVELRRRCNARRVAEYKERQRDQADQAARWCAAQPNSAIRARLDRIKTERGHAAERRVLTEALAKNRL